MQPPEPGTAYAQLHQAICNLLEDLRADKKELTSKSALQQYRKMAEAWRAKYARSPKWGHRSLQRTTESNTRGIQALKDPTTGEVRTDAASKLCILKANMQQLSQAPPGGKAGVFSTDPNGPRGYPWEDPEAADTYQLVTGVDVSAPRRDLLARFQDYQLFKERLRALGNNKAPGWDAVPNELLKYMPENVLVAIHQLFITMWITGETPAAWKRSQTVLLAKDGDPTDPNNYRPIGLMLTVYKLWTSLLTEVLAEYAETQRILGDSQEGFRRGRNTQRQLANLLNALEDAKHTRRNIYLMYVDFSSAFNTVDHDKLLQLMWDMGFPWHAVQAVRSLYTGATTVIKTPFGETDDIDIERGTLQGDTLSPFLFLLFIEPLLRWLHMGGKGYKHGCLPEEDRAKYACSAPAYADDLAVVCNSVGDLARQADKIGRFLQWSGMKVNPKKCGATGMLYGSAATGHLDGPLHRNTIQALQRQLAQIRLAGDTVPFYHPHNEPYKYLGVWLTPSLNWQHQMTNMVETVVDKTEAILRCPASPKQKLQLIHTLLKPYIRYSLSTGAYTASDIARLDSLLAQAARFAMRLPGSAPTAMVLEDRDRGGLGVGSLLTAYITELTAQLTDSMNDGGRLGAVTKPLLHLQVTGVGNMQDAALTDHLRHSRLLRTVSLLHGQGGRMTHCHPDGSIESYELRGSQLTELIGHLQHDPAQLGVGRQIPSSCFLPLLEVGVTSVTQLLEASGTHIIAATELQHHLQRQGIAAKVTSKHKRALNILTACGATPNKRQK